MPDTPRLAYLVSHTHWDREWYLTFPRFRVQLVEVVDEVLDRLQDDPALTHFVLDGQMLALEDYLAVRPEQADLVKDLAEAGKLALGPWYILPDEFLVSAEATVRNLQLGHRVAAQLGAGAQKVGYMPDSFGHLAQMPQILQQVGIDSFIYTRGNGDEIDDLGLEFLWEAPDGSRVLAVNQQDGYCNAAALGHAELWHAHTRRAIEPAHAVAKIRELFRMMAARSHADVWLLNNGCDHHPPQRDYAAVLAALREAFPGTTFVTGRFEDYLAASDCGTPPRCRPGAANCSAASCIPSSRACGRRACRSSRPTRAASTCSPTSSSRCARRRTSSTASRTPRARSTSPGAPCCRTTPTTPSAAAPPTPSTRPWRRASPRSPTRPSTCSRACSAVSARPSPRPTRTTARPSSSSPIRCRCAAPRSSSGW